MFHFGFSYVGLVYLLMLFLPNAIWAKRKPEGYEQEVKKENKVLQVLERIGEALSSCCVLIFSDFNVRFSSAWCAWLLASFLLMLLYEAYWVRYFRSERKLSDFYRGICGIPVAGATLPVCAFFLLGIYGSNAFLLASTILLGIGHVGIHLQHRKEVLGKRKVRVPLRVLQGLGAAAGLAFVAVNLVVIGCRNVNYFRHYRMIERGVDEGIFVTLGGQEQYVLIRGMDHDNPVIIYLHGGPSSPDTYVTYGFSDWLIDDYTVVAWDQRGCGRTYVRNADSDPENKSASFERAKADLDELVDYVRRRFGKEQVILLGHSYGTILGSEYALEHPDKVSAYIGAAQVVSLEKSDVYSYEDVLRKAAAAGDDTAELVSAFDAFRASGSLMDLMKLRSLTSKYHPASVPDRATWMAVVSPYFGMDDLWWFGKQLGDAEAYFDLNRQLFDHTLAFDAHANGLTYEMPVAFLSGTCDWVCPVDSVRAYAESISAPDVRVELLEGCGHNLQYAAPEEFAERVRKVLAGEGR